MLRIKKLYSKSGEEITIPCSVRVGDIKSLQTSNRGSISISVKERPQIPDIPVVYLGSNRWLISKRYDGNINTETELEKDPNPSGPGEHWRVVNFDDNELNIEPYFEGKPGIIYLRHYIYTAFPRPLRWVYHPIAHSNYGSMERKFMRWRVKVYSGQIMEEMEEAMWFLISGKDGIRS